MSYLIWNCKLEFYLKKEVECFADYNNKLIIVNLFCNRIVDILIKKIFQDLTKTISNPMDS